MPSFPVRIAAVAVLLAVALSSALEAGPPTSRPTASDLRAIRRYHELHAETVKHFAAKDHASAAAACREGMKLAPTDSTFPYNLACALARMGKPDAALEALGKSIANGHASPDHMVGDADLATLRGTERFKELLAAARVNAAKRRGRYEPGTEIKGVRTVEGNPKDGLRWRLHLAPWATKDNPDRLIVWMHPAGGSMNPRAEKLAKGFVDRGWALLVFSQKDFRMWTGADARKLDVSLKEVAKVTGLDARRPVLMGYSAGGQMSLQLYAADPDRFGGYVLDAAYPIRRTATGVALTDPPKDDGVSKAPIFVVVGTRDGGAKAWRKATDPWRAAGVPLVVHYVPDKGHTWLFDAERLKLLHDWLAAVRKGELPGKASPTTQPVDDD